MKKTDYIAIYAAIIATCGMVWNIILWYKQRGKLRVKAAICEDKGQYTIEVEPKHWGNLLRIDVVNSGKSNLTLSEIGLKTARPNPLFFWQKLPQVRMIPSSNQILLPYTLEPTKTGHWLIDNTDILLRIRTIKKFFIKDSQGKEWYISRRQMRRMRKIIRLEKDKGDGGELKSQA